jgi:hypothetical protein
MVRLYTKKLQIYKTERLTQRLQLKENSIPGCEKKITTNYKTSRDTR